MIEEFYVGDAVVQKDKRIRLPKQVIENLGIEPGKTELKISINASSEEVILKVKKEKD